MNTEQALLRLLLSHSFYTSVKDRISPNFFEAEILDIFKTIVDAQERYQHDLTLDEVKALHLANSPTLSRAAKNNVFEVFSDIESLDGIAEDVGADLLSALWKKEMFRQIAELGVKGLEGQVADLEGLRKIIDSAGEDFIPDIGGQVVGNDLDELLETTDRNNAWKFNIASIAEKVPGIAGGEFMMVLGRSNVGKSASAVSLVSAPGGWASQGARCLIIANEESGRRQLMRHVTAACQQSRDWVQANRKQARQIWEEIADKIILVDAVGMSINQLSAAVRRHQPDITICDQLDKIQVGGSFNGTHEKLRVVYTEAREIAKKYNTVMYAVSQASAEAEGKSVVTPTMAEGSRTGKFSEIDLCFGIGKYAQAEMADEDFTRLWHVGKNKLNGWHGTISTILNQDTSTYVA